MAWQVSPWMYIVQFLIQAITGLIPLLTAFLAGAVVNSLAKALAEHNSNLTPLYWLVGGLALAQLVLNQLAYLDSYLDSIYALKFDGFIWENLLHQYTRLDQTYYDDAAFNDKFNKIVQNAFAMRNLSSQSQNLFGSTVQLIAAAAALWTLSPWLVPVILITLAPVMIIEATANVRQWHYYDRNGEDFRMQVYLRNSLTDNTKIREIKLYGISGWLTDRWRKHFEIARRGQAEIRQKAQRQLGVAGILDAGVQLGIQIWLINLVVSRGLAGIGQFVFYRQVVQNFASAGAAATRMLQLMQANSLYVDDYFDFMSLEPRLVQPISPRSIQAQGAPTVVFENVSFKYPNAKQWALRHLSLEVTPGEDVALIGENGAGKTTFVKLLMRLYDPTEGRILIDGVDIREIDLEDWNSRIGVLFQDFNKYGPLTLGENIQTGKVSRPAVPAELDKAVEQAGGDNFRSGLANGLDQILTNAFKGGVDLSGGQWQRVALARAFYRDAPILVLDEPTSAIDAKGEYEIFQQIKRVQASKTTIIISHRFSTVRNAHRIIVLEKGRVTESGSHDELMKLAGRYRELFELQAAGYR